MPTQVSFTKRVFHFGFDARTSRGAMQDKTSWFITAFESNSPDKIGIGECGPLPGLSIDAHPGFEGELDRVLRMIMELSLPPHEVYRDLHQIVPAAFPSIIFGLESALLDLMSGGRRIIYDNSFTRGQGIPINGLIWMGNVEFMMKQVKEKIELGFTCLKLKVGGLDFNTELKVIAGIRQYGGDFITLRLDANGNFPPHEALHRLQALAKFNIHSIEQPVAPRHDTLQTLCSVSPIPIALDEELIQYHDHPDKRAMLEFIRPAFLVLKPTLHGGLQGCAEWISIAEQLGIGWWITSALESSIGLNAICQFAANYSLTLPQGLGTGSIYVDNIPSPLVVEHGHIHHRHMSSWGPLKF